MPVVVDVVFVFVLVVAASLVEHYWFWPRFRADVAGGARGARVRGYRRGIVGQWLFVAVATAIWLWYGRPLSWLRLGAPSGWRLWLSVGLGVAIVVLVALQLASVKRLSAAQRVAARPKLGSVAFLLPHTREDHRWFLALSATAGFCEELLYRGYLAWFFTPWLGGTWAMVAVVVLFGIGHAYQGRTGAVRATLAGAVMAVVVLATNWLVPAMIIHAMIDAGSGTVGYWLLRTADVTPDHTTNQPADLATDAAARIATEPLS